MRQLPVLVLLSAVLLGAGAPAEDPFQVVDGLVKLPVPLEFDSDSAAWKPDSEAALEHVRDFLRAHPEVSQLRIEAHVNAEATDAAAQLTSELRALAVAKWLKSEGIECLRMRALGFGGRFPVASKETRDGRRRNSRIDFIVTERRGRPVAAKTSSGGVEVTGACD